MRNTESKIDNLICILKQQRILYFRAFLRRENNSWKVYSLRVDNLDFLGKTEKSFLNYGEIAFIFGKTSGNEVAQWLEEKCISYEKQKHEIPQFQSNIWSERYASKTNIFWLKPPFPFTIYRLYHSDRDKLAVDYSPLVGDGNPSFPSLGAAIYYFIYQMEHQEGQSIPEDLIFCIGHQECWLGKIHLRPSSIKVEVNGTNVKGTRLELRAGMQHFESLLKKRGNKKFAFPNGLPEKLWVALTKGNDWLDYRKLDLRSSFLLNQEDVVVKSSDKSTEIKGIIARGESETTEFKREIPTDSAKLTKTVAAFANGNGGVIIVGVEDDGTIIGVPGDITKENERLVQIIRNNLLRSPIFRVEQINVDGLPLLTVWIEAGINKPYGINPKSPKYYVRRGATSSIATPEEIGYLVCNLKFNVPKS